MLALFGTVLLIAVMLFVGIVCGKLAYDIWKDSHRFVGALFFVCAVIAVVVGVSIPVVCIHDNGTSKYYDAVVVSVNEQHKYGATPSVTVDAVSFGNTHAFQAIKCVNAPSFDCSKLKIGNFVSVRRHYVDFGTATTFTVVGPAHSKP